MSVRAFSFKQFSLQFESQSNLIQFQLNSKTFLSLTLKQIKYLSVFLLIVLLYFIMPSTIKFLLLISFVSGFSYFGYKIFYQPEKKKNSHSHQKSIFPSVYELPGIGGKSSIGWTIDPEEQERIDKTIGRSATNSITANSNNNVNIISETINSDDGDLMLESVNLLAKPVEESKEEFDSSIINYTAIKPLLPESKPSHVKIINDPVKTSHYKQLFDELIKTEQTYITALQSCTNVYILPLHKAINNKEIKLTSQDVSILFSNIDAILKFHLLLQNDLKKSNSSQVGEVFLKYSDFLKLYVGYVSNYSKCIELMNKLSLENKSMTQFLIKQRTSNTDSNGLDLMSYLIQPIQRIPRYEMLLKGLVQSAQDKKLILSLTSALDKIHSIALLVNERKREIENSSLILELQSRIKNRISAKNQSLLAPHRKLIRFGDVFKIKRDKKQKINKKSNFVVLLFTDLIILVKSESYEFKLEIEAINIISIDHSITDEKILFLSFKDGKETIKLELELLTGSERESWLISLRQFCENGRK